MDFYFGYNEETFRCIFIVTNEQDKSAYCVNQICPKPDIVKLFRTTVAKYLPNEFNFRWSIYACNAKINYPVLFRNKEFVFNTLNTISNHRHCKVTIRKKT
jgi:hypothetical protein